ncbi:uncharacterized protein LOC111292864 [Durio zibethinus]|uniref:Uncharacterized protein LOC111292864 n=1 Tax=Durio zibethinus TaxID=66656 RepID=A0A6P5YLJ4_DURZI|nr:uncharacterized protein LOC111292864 [Durio zibethinus]
MDTSILQSLASKSPPSTNPVCPKASSSTTYIQVCLHRRPRLVKVCCMNSSTDNSSSSSSASGSKAPPPIAPPNIIEVRFKRGSRRRRQLQEDGFGKGQQPMKAKAAADTAPKKWEEISITEKAIAFYVGEKGWLFWLNKFAYASIFIVIRAWIFFRFDAPALNLYELDSPHFISNLHVQGFLIDTTMQCLNMVFTVCKEFVASSLVNNNEKI